MSKVSVIMPVYNTEKYLHQCLDSVINQTLKDIEIICVDDGSTDNSLIILQEYAKKDNRIKILTQQNEYAGVARNNGLKIATGEYLSFLDSDDFFELDMLESMYNKAKKDNSDIVICSWKSYSDILKEVIRYFRIDKKYIRLSPFKPINIASELYSICKPNPWTKLINHQFFTDNNLKFENCICCNDLTCICLAMVLAKKISVMQNCYVNYRILQKDNLTANRNKNFSAVLYALNRLEEELKKHGLYKLYKDTFIKKAISSFNCGKKQCTLEDINNRKLLAKEMLSDDIYYAIYNEPKERSVSTIKHEIFF